MPVQPLAQEAPLEEGMATHSRQRSPAGDSPRGHKESDTTKATEHACPESHGCEPAQALVPHTGHQSDQMTPFSGSSLPSAENQGL